MYNGAKLLSALWVMNQIKKTKNGFNVVMLSCKCDESSSSTWMCCEVGHKIRALQ